MNFGPKVIEVRFQLTGSEAAIRGGVVCIPGAILGSIIGGVYAKVFKPTGRGLMIFTAIIQILAGNIFDNFSKFGVRLAYV